MHIKQIAIITILTLTTISIAIHCVQPVTRLYNQPNKRHLEKENVFDIFDQEFQRKLRGEYTLAVKEYVEINNINFKFDFEKEKIMLFNPEIITEQLWVGYINKLGRTIAKIIIQGGFGPQEGKIIAFESYDTSNN